MFVKIYKNFYYFNSNSTYFTDEVNVYQIMSTVKSNQGCL